MEVEKRKEIEKKEREQYIEDWIQRNKNKGKKKKVIPKDKDVKMKDIKK
jgi:ABC-type lipoprotein release transport system permease subunit